MKSITYAHAYDMSLAIDIRSNPAFSMCKLWVTFDHNSSGTYQNSYAILMPNMDVIGMEERSSKDGTLPITQEKLKTHVNSTVAAFHNVFDGEKGTPTDAFGQHQVLTAKARGAFWSGIIKPATTALYCAFIDSPLGEITLPVRDFIKNDLRALVIQEVRVVLLELTAQLKAANVAEREAIINKLLNEIPKQTELIDALKNAMDKK